MARAATSRVASSSARAAIEIAIRASRAEARSQVPGGWSPVRPVVVLGMGAATIGAPAAVLLRAADVVRAARAASVAAPAAAPAVDVARAAPVALAAAPAVDRVAAVLAALAAVRAAPVALAAVPVVAVRAARVDSAPLLAAVLLVAVPAVRAALVAALAAAVAARVAVAVLAAAVVAVLAAVAAAPVVAVLVAAVVAAGPGSRVATTRAGQVVRAGVRPIATPRAGRSPTPARSIPIVALRRP